MTDATDDQGFQPTDVEATRGREQGLGVGERELNQQGDVGNTVAAPEEDRDFQSASQDAEGDDQDLLDENTSVLGTDEDDTGYSTDDDDDDLEDAIVEDADEGEDR